MEAKNNKPGRPTAITKLTVHKLEQALKDGFTIEMACYVSGISRSTYYAHLHTDVEFMNKMELSQSWSTERAKQIVIQEINKGNLKPASEPALKITKSNLLEWRYANWNNVCNRLRASI